MNTVSSLSAVAVNPYFLDVFGSNSQEASNNSNQFAHSFEFLHCLRWFTRCVWGVVSLRLQRGLRIPSAVRKHLWLAIREKRFGSKCIGSWVMEMCSVNTVSSPLLKLTSTSRGCSQSSQRAFFFWCTATHSDTNQAYQCSRYSSVRVNSFK